MVLNSQFPVVYMELAGMLEKPDADVRGISNSANTRLSCVKITDGAHVTVELVPVVAVILDAAAAAAAEEAAAAAAERPALAFIAADNSICNSSQRTFSKAAYHY
ncbi:hypothetical protein GQX74_000653 [Glossina fuscipes]|uniref:Uncharacterized protein n=1 Tax=Glossina palpalis gambiensis TaxID=67801 RepID=A0A1B0BT57_9MUSC|nr:hypothetical protein GQX74_000653 [Glossina fuscipes]